MSDTGNLDARVTGYTKEWKREFDCMIDSLDGLFLYVYVYMCSEYKYTNDDDDDKKS